MIKNFYSPIFLSIVIITFIVSITGCTAIKTIDTINSGEKIIHNTSDTVVPFEIKGHTMIIKTRLNNSQTEYSFIFDTGALTVVSEQVAKELKLQSGLKVRSQGTGGKSKTAQLVKLNNIIVDDAEVKDCAAIIVDLSKLYGTDISGILGSNFLKHYKVIIDYQTKKITLSHEILPTIVKDGEIKISFKTDMKNGFAPEIECRIDDKIDAVGIIDTGSPATSDLPLQIMKRLNAFKKGEVLISNGGMSGGMFGMSETNYLLRLKELKVGSIILKNIPSVSHSVDNVIFGNKFLSNYLVTLNYPVGEMILKPLKTEFSTNIESYGLSLAIKNKKVLVAGVWKNSEADRSGIRPGLEILTVNSQTANELSLFDLKSIFENKEADSMQIKYLDGKNTHEIDLHKAVLLPALN